MRFCARISVLVLVFAALLIPSKSNAQSVSVSAPKLEQCGHGFVFCNGRQAYSLSEIESGAVQIRILPFLPSEVVIVNDTGAPVTHLQFTLTTLQFLDSFVECQIASSARSLLKTCSGTALSSGLSSNPFNLVSVQFDYEAGNKKGIADGAYFDITTAGFLSGSYLGGGTGGDGGSTGSGGDGGSTGSGNGGGTGTASY